MVGLGTKVSESASRREACQRAAWPCMPEDFEVNSVACRTQPSFRVKVGVGTGGTKWPKALQFMVKLRGDEDAEDAVRRWLFSERGQLHAAQPGGAW